MQQSFAKSMVIVCLGLECSVLPVPSISTSQITEIIDATGDGAGNTLLVPFDVAVDGNVYVTGFSSDNTFRITDPCGGNTIV